ncbi:hypothetical protein AB751O23_DD_00020 [Chlamydiales bacterium SCGC AB-751-O23]|jgi:hypothetical protein|nr:hypothetical protein AB751O23_DD_00020 [Chlamydiales bacterium SCGC AB-751-O23]
MHKIVTFSLCYLFLLLPISGFTLEDSEQVLNLLDAKELKGSGKILSETRDLTTVDRVSINDNFEVEVILNSKTPSNLETQNKKLPSLTVTADDNLMPLITTEIQGQTLFIQFNNESDKDPLLPFSFKSTVISSNKNPKITLFLDSLKEVSLSGSSKIEVKNLSEKELLLRAHGSSTSKISGNVDLLELKLSGSSELDAKELVCNEINFKVSGSTKSSIQVKNVLAGKASGAAKVNYYGKPHSQKVELSGVSELKSV